MCLNYRDKPLPRYRFYCTPDDIYNQPSFLSYYQPQRSNSQKFLFLLILYFISFYLESDARTFYAMENEKEESTNVNKNNKAVYKSEKEKVKLQWPSLIFELS